MKDFEIKGTWWLPDNADRKIPGTLRFLPKTAISLELHGSLHFSKSSELLILEILHGQSSEGKEITLYDCFETNNTEISSNIVVNHVFIGKWFHEPEDIKFPFVRVSYEHLEEWLGGIRFERKLARRPFSVKHNPPQALTVKLPSIGARLTLNYTFSAKSEMIHSAELSHTDCFELRPRKQQNYRWYIDNLHTLHVFLVLLIGGIIRVRTVTGFGDMTGNVGRRIIREEIEIHAVPVEMKPDKVDTWDMIFKLPVLRDNIQNYLDKWFAEFELLAPVYDLFLPIMSRHSRYHETIFLNLTQVIEAFHRRIYGNLYLDDKDYQPIYELLVKTIPGSIPKGLRSSLKSKLSFGNEISLRSSFNKLLKGAIWDECLSHFIKDKNDFIGTVVDTRNYYVHYDKKLVNLYLKPRDGLYHCNELLTLILFVLLYQHIGIPVKTIFEAVKDRGRFKSYLLDRRHFYYANRLDHLKF